ncbi:MAG TPA: hypothetical protein DHW64_10335 [Chitinophagaceae bacterium]|nr:hypothetical protein [Chitinophagaceae bacterium]
MMIPFGQSASIINGLQDAIQTGKPWVGINQSIQQLSFTDLHFFQSEIQALNFRDFNQQQQKNIVLLPVELTHEYLVDRFREAYADGIQKPTITIEPQFILDLHDYVKTESTMAALIEEMDAFDWSKVFYDPLEANTEAESFSDKVVFNRLESLIETLSAYAAADEKSKTIIADLLHRYWDGEPMEVQIDSVLIGSLGKKIFSESVVQEQEHPIANEVLDLARIALANHKQWVAYNNGSYLIEKGDVLFFNSKDDAHQFAQDNTSDKDSFQVIQIKTPEDLLRQIPYGNHLHISTLKQNTMNMENLQYLKDNIKYTGFGEALYPELEKNIAAKKDEFQLHFTTQIGNRPFDAVLDFRKSNTSDMYFFNRYKASIENSNGEKIEQSLQINKGKGVTAKEAYNLLQGRAVKKEMTNAKGEEYQAWMQLDFDNKDEKGNSMVNKYTENYGYELRESIARFPVLELDGGDKEKDLLRSLEKGNIQMATMDKDGEQIKVFLEANPKYKTINVYDEQFKMMKHEELPKVEKGQSVRHEPAAGESKQEVKQEVRKGRELKNNTMVTKKRTGQKKGMKI